MQLFIRLSFFVVSIVFLSSLTVLANENTEREDEVKNIELQEQQEQARQLESTLSFQQFESCEDMQSTLHDFLRDNKEYFTNTWWWPPRFHDWVMVEPMVDTHMETVVSWERSILSQDDSPSSDGFSTTNLQVAWVDEPDIFKTDWAFLYYYNGQKNQIYILQSPWNDQNEQPRLEDATVLSSLVVPEWFSQVELFFQWDRLVILWQRWRSVTQQSLLDTSSRVAIVVYDIADRNAPKLERYIDLDGTYTDARIIDNQLYVLSNLSVNRRYAYQMFDQWTPIPIAWLMPREIDIVHNISWQRPLMIQWREYPYGISLSRAWCDQINYLLPTQESMQHTSEMPSFTIVRTIDLQQWDKKIDTTVAFGATQTIHMSASSLYLVAPFYMQHPFRCRQDQACIIPRFRWWQIHTLIHKFLLAEDSIDYVNSTLIDWMPLNQYSMSENDQWYFRIITQTRSPEINTHLFIMNPSLQWSWMVRNIQRNEELKASRFIGDKLYMVTFELTDPLFVLDLEDPYNPMIIWELKIPWYSTYLHPYAPEQDDVQYLIGIWYDTEETQRWWFNNLWIKIDLYKVDFNQQQADWSILVTQEFSEVYGQQWSWSEALHNPRMFVWNSVAKQLLLPLLLTDHITQQQCTVTYWQDWSEIGRNCWDSHRSQSTFAWMKIFSIHSQEGIQELHAYDYTDRFEKNNHDFWFPTPRPMVWDIDWVQPFAWDEIGDSSNNIYQWQFMNQYFRVWYIGDVYFTLSNMFAHFALPSLAQEKFIDF